MRHMHGQQQRSHQGPTLCSQRDRMPHNSTALHASIHLHTDDGDGDGCASADMVTRHSMPTPPSLSHTHMHMQCSVQHPKHRKQLSTTTTTTCHPLCTRVHCYCCAGVGRAFCFALCQPLLPAFVLQPGRHSG